MVLQKISLEQTLKLLSEEVEFLSKNNERLLKDLKKRDFFDKYNITQNEVSSA